MRHAAARHDLEDAHATGAAQPPPVPGVSGLAVLAEAGFSVVYRGILDRTGAAVAVKVLATPFDRDTREQFDADRTRIGRLRHVPSILQVDDVDVLDDGRPYLVAELCADSVGALLARGDRLDAEEVTAVGSAAAAALAAAHGSGVLHGRMTPTNLLVHASGQPVLSDFGLALRQHYPGDPTDAGEYTAPETLRDGIIDARSDLYGLGATLYAALTGRPPFPARIGEHPSERVLRVLRQAPPPLGEDAVPVELGMLLAELLATEPGERPPDAAGVAARFDALLARPVPPVGGPVPGPPRGAPARRPAGTDAAGVGGWPGRAEPAGAGQAEPAQRPAETGPADLVGQADRADRADLARRPADADPADAAQPAAETDGAGAGRPGEPGEHSEPGEHRDPGDLLAELDAAAKAAAESAPDDPPESDPTASGAGWFRLLSAADTDDDPTRPAPVRRRLALLAKVAGGTAMVVAAALLTRHIGSGPTPATGPAAAPTASATAAAPAATVRLTSVKVGDQGRKVTLSWQGPPGMSYAVIVAMAGGSAPSAKLVNQARSRVFAIQPGQPYCFQVQGTFDGVNAVQSAPKGINGAACQN